MTQATRSNKSHHNTSTSFQLTAVIASCGVSFEVEVNPSITGMELKQKIAEDTSISMDDQVLFTPNGILLKKLSLPLSHATYKNDIIIFNRKNECYSISPVAPHIYIFDKHHGEHPSIPREYVLNPSNYRFDEEALSQGPSSPLTAEERLNPNLNIDVLNKYKIEYRHNYTLLKHVAEECIGKMRASKKYVKQIQLQYKSLKVLMKHFHHLKDKLSKQQKKFASKCTTQMEEHQQYLNEFETDLTNLQSVELHSSLQTKARKTMLDVVDEGSFRKWFEKAVTSQEKQKTLQMERIRTAQTIENKFIEIRQSIEDIKRKKINFGAVKRELEANEKLKSEVLSMIKLYGIKCAKIENTLSILMENEEHKESMTAMMELNDEMKGEQFDSDRSKLRSTATSFFNMLQHIGSLQEAMANEFTLNVADITNLNGLISSESRAMDAYAIALDRKDDLFFEFVKLKALPSAYEHCIAEIIRRRAFGQLMENEINRHLNGIFDRFRNSEIAKRKSFIAEYGMLPVDLVSGLTKMPGVITITYHGKNERMLPHMADDGGDILNEVCCEFEEMVHEPSESQWKWNYNNDSYSDKSNRQNHRNCNNIQLIAFERNKWERDKLQLMKEYEEKLTKLNNETQELESRNKDLEIELEAWKRNVVPDPPSDHSQMQSFDGMDSVYIANQLSTLLGASIPNVNINRSRLEQSALFIQKIFPSKSASARDAQNEVLQSDLEKKTREMESKENAIQKLKIENDKLRRQNDEYSGKLDKLSESSSALRNEMESMLNRHRSELEQIEIANAQQTEEISTLRQDITQNQKEITTLQKGKTDLLQQIKLLSDVSEEWEEKFHSLHNEFMAYKAENANDITDIEWFTSFNFIWFNGAFEKDQIVGNNFLFVRDNQSDSYRALLDYKPNTSTVFLDEELIADTLKKLDYPQLVTGEVIYIIERTMPQKCGQFKKGDRVLIATAGSIQPVNFNL